MTVQPAPSLGVVSPDAFLRRIVVGIFASQDRGSGRQFECETKAEGTQGERIIRVRGAVDGADKKILAEDCPLNNELYARIVE